jgi:bisphosphoglycerate-dependent phosphoglycerate mutase
MKYVKYAQDIPISWFESLIRSLAHRRLELHRQFPKAESLKDCMDRTIPYYKNVVVPKSINNNQNVLISSSE